MYHSSSIFESLANSLPLSLLIKDRSGERVFANEAYLKWRGASADEVIGKRDEDLFPPEIAQKYIADDRWVLEQGKSLHSVEKTIGPDGTVQWIERVKSPVRDREGTILGLAILFWNVTEKIRAEASRDLEQHLLQTLLDNIPDSIYFKDRQSRFLRISTAMATKFGMKRAQEAIGHTDADIFTGEHARGAREDEVRIMETGIPIVDQIERETWPHREDTWCITTKMPLKDHRGRLLGTFGISRDITELKHSQDALRHALRAADSANQAKSDFLANMSHEIRTPMNAIIGMTELLSQTQLDAEQREFVELVSESADSLLRLLNDILDFSKIEARKLDLESIPFSLRETVGKAAQTLTMRAAEKGLELACRIAPDVPDRLCGDAGRLRQILINLIGNAIKFTDEGEVVVDVAVADGEAVATENAPDPQRGCQAEAGEDRAGEAGVAEPENGDGGSLPIQRIAFRIRDTGIGIAPQHQAAVLEAFTQADASTTRRFGGTGLGLSIAGQLIGLMHGKLELESAVGIGTTFFFTIELPLAPEQSDRRTSQRLSGLVGLPVLVVDDNSTNRRILEEIFKAWHFQPHLVDSGPAAIEAQQRAAREGRAFPLVILDCMMPAMDGFEVAEALRRDHDADATKIIMLASADRHGDHARCEKLGISRLLNKPVLQSELFDSVLQVLNIEPGTDLPANDDQLAPCRPLRVLVAEDGVANQHVAVGMLKALGHTPVVASDGREALSKWSHDPFDVILMDVHMPVMDGLEATRAIRLQERSSGQHVPIIALTAAAMSADVQACRECGMDEYLSKPIHPRRLHEMLLRFSGQDGSAETESTGVPATSHNASSAANDPSRDSSRDANATAPRDGSRTTADPGGAANEPMEDDGVFDLVHAASRIPGGMQGVHRLIDVFRAECESLMKTLRSSLPEGEARDVQRAAHTLKGSAMLFEAKRVHRLAGRIEHCSAQGDLQTAAELLPDLERATDELLNALP